MPCLRNSSASEASVEQLRQVVRLKDSPLKHFTDVAIGQVPHLSVYSPLDYYGATHGKCISILEGAREISAHSLTCQCSSYLCSFSSTARLILSNCPVACSSAFTSGASTAHQRWKDDVGRTSGSPAASNGRLPKGVAYSLHCERAHPSRYKLWEGPRMKTRLLLPCDHQYCLLQPSNRSTIKRTCPWD